jgi:adenosylcobinamide-GDP ribazoletransferase
MPEAVPDHSGLGTALRFLTILPVPGRAAVPEEVLGRSTAWFPLVGVLLGAILAAGGALASLLWSPFTVRVLVVAGWAALTRGLHLDGLADAADGLVGGVSRGRKLAIMKDSRIGTFGVLAVVVLLALKLAFLAELEGLALWRVLVPACALGRWAMLLAVFAFPVAVPGGLAGRFKRRCRWPQLAVGTVLAAAASFFFLGVWALSLLGLLGLATLLWSLAVRRALGGHTGDTYGALGEMGEALALAALSVLGRFALI